MTVRVKLFALAKDLAGRDELVLDVPNGASLADVRRLAASECPALARILPHAMWAVNAEYANENTTITETSEVALIPPVSGG